MNSYKKEIDFYKNATIELQKFVKRANIQQLHAELIEFKNTNKPLSEKFADAMKIILEAWAISNSIKINSVQRKQQPQFAQGGIVSSAHIKQSEFILTNVFKR